MTSILEITEPKCLCGLPARLRKSRTSPDLIRLFYDCPRDGEYQCAFFCWFDELLPTNDRHEELEEEIINLERLLDFERSIWEQEKLELTSELSILQAELDGIKEKIKIANESDLMPPLDRLSTADEANQSTIDLHMIPQQERHGAEPIGPIPLSPQ
ncbi:Uncharacterized protein TCM_007165 [Theobroma cacao]|uniref:GRF-type domain-containing protein n=1 Tax=Theobroma cacao TaxID=3641 RepID=A0A061E221_THECC|nr:Uncharacterized protein TCM_007165 [Theobroma cacao]